MITLLLVEDPLPFHTAIEELRAGLGFAAGNEFKWVNSAQEVRWAFLRMLRRQDFTARVLVVDKSLMAGHHLRQRETFYNFLVQMVLRHDNETIRDATDESIKNKKSKQHLATYLRRELNAGPREPKIKAVRYHRSHSDNLIQAADLLSGAIYAHYHRGNSEFLDYIRVKVGDLWEWRPRTQ